MSKKPKPTKSPIPAEQLNLPVGFDATGKMLTLREVQAQGTSGVLPLSAQPAERQVELTTARIEAQPHFELAMVGAGLLDKQRAVEEVRARTEIGRALIEIEQRVINSLLEEVAAR